MGQEQECRVPPVAPTAGSQAGGTVHGKLLPVISHRAAQDGGLRVSRDLRGPEMSEKSAQHPLFSGRNRGCARERRLQDVWNQAPAEVVERLRGAGGEIQLQKRGRHFEMIYNGVFLMATYNGASERAAVKRGLERLLPVHARGGAGLRLLLGGLGMGFSLQEALRCPQVERVVVAEIEGAVIEWNRRYLGGFNGDALRDPRVTLLHRDFLEVVEALGPGEKTLPGGQSAAYHLITVDTDNGSTWLSRAENEALYGDRGLELLRRGLLQGGAACFWCAQEEPEFEQRLRRHFRSATYEKVLEQTGREGGFYLAEKA